ncbi:hypothetical protein DFP72DRAFT_1062664 [Ephemerocybe angulata]|uniref:Uncharacterized protein n=1 Tax=Ephemerocybe angulata TaxID=980116 RepID=A0A8H6MCM0_9AGAR|nr:hypothetical protein DFP72DRAFT_1062664 [Tulosesus angulatus]
MDKMGGHFGKKTPTTSTVRQYYILSEALQAYKMPTEIMDETIGPPATVAFQTMPSLFSTVVSAALLLASAAAVQAVDVRAYAGTGCQGPYISCNNIARKDDKCCNFNSAFASHNLAGSDMQYVLATRGFAFPNCDLNSPWHGVYTNTCNTPSFAMFSTQIYWLNSGRREEFKFPTNTTNCEKVEPDGFGFVDEDGVEHQGVISLEKKEAIIEAVHKGDYVALKALL